MADGAVAAPAEGNSADLGGYREQMNRTLGPFQVFAISFAFISVAVGVFGTFNIVLQNAGPAGIWLWVMVALGQTLVSLVIAQFAARIPLTGSSYQWASRLANPRIGWGFGWLSYCYLGIGVVAVDNAMASQTLLPLAGLDPNGNEGTARVITLVVLLVQVVLAIASTRIVAMLNAAAVVVEVSIIGVLVIALVIAMAVTGLGSVENLTSRGVAAGSADYFAIGGGLMSAMIMGLTTLVGFDAAANLAEEAKDPFRNVPRAIVGAVMASGVLGLLFLITLTVAIPDVTRISASGSPVAAVLREQLGPVMEHALLLAITFAFFAAGMVTMTVGARLVFAMARDGRFPAHRLMRRVNARTQTPIPATLLIFAGGVVLMVALPGKALEQLIIASTILPILIYGATVVLYLGVRKQLGRQKGAFDLGRLDLPVAIIALVWLVAALVALMTPGAARTPVLIVGGLLVLGGLFFLAMLIFDRKSMDTEETAAIVRRLIIPTNLPADPPVPVFVADPYPYYHRLRSEAPVFWDDQLRGWLLTRHADVSAVLRDTRFVTSKTFTRNNQFPGLQRILSQWMVYKDPPEHTRLRSLANNAFTPRILERLRPHMEQVVGDVLDRVQPTGQMELIADLAFPLAVEVMALMLGVPAPDLVKFRDWALAIDLVLEPVNLISPEVFRDGDRVFGELTEYFRGLAAQRRQEPRDDLLSALVAAEVEGKRLSMDELVATCTLILFAGHASTVNVIGNGTLALLRHPDQWALLRSQPELIPSAVEELLRYDSSIQVVSRIAREDLEIGDQKVCKDQEVFLLLAAANRDPERFPDPDRLDITRADNGHLAFGDGVHHCLGEPLVRAEAQVAFAALVKRMPNLRLATDVLEYQQTVSFRGVKALPVTF